MKSVLILMAFLYALHAESSDISQNIFILEPLNQSAEQRALGAHYTNEGYRAASFGAQKIARDLFYKACSLGDNLGCLSLNKLNAPLGVDNLVLKKQECAYGVGESCFWLFRHYAGESTLDSFKTDWYLNKACKLGKMQACALKSERFKPYILDNYQLLGNRCFKNDAQSCYVLGVAHFLGRLDGKKVAQNRTYALELLQKSCVLGAKMGCVEYHKLRGWR
ncbi:hypothetical protein [Helicobacter sp. 23-1045]